MGVAAPAAPCRQKQPCHLDAGGPLLHMQPAQHSTNSRVSSGTGCTLEPCNCIPLCRKRAQLDRAEGNAAVDKRLSHKACSNGKLSQTYLTLLSSSVPPKRGTAAAGCQTLPPLLPLGCAVSGCPQAAAGPTHHRTAVHDTTQRQAGAGCSSNPHRDCSSLRYVMQPSTKNNN